MRRGEIGGLTWKDFDFTRNTVNIHAAKVRTDENKFIIKAPKAKASKRVLEFPPWVMERIKAHDEILPMNIDRLTARFSAFLKKNGYKHFRFHDLRHFACSYYLQAGIPEASVQRRGGWQTPNMMHTVYRHELNRSAADAMFIDCINTFKQ